MGQCGSTPDSATPYPHPEHRNDPDPWSPARRELDELVRPAARQVGQLLNITDHRPLPRVTDSSLTSQRSSVETPDPYEPFEPDTVIAAPAREPVAKPGPRGSSLWEVGRRHDLGRGLVLARLRVHRLVRRLGRGRHQPERDRAGTPARSASSSSSSASPCSRWSRSARPGIELPATVPESLVVIALGSLATIFVLIRADRDPRPSSCPRTGAGSGSGSAWSPRSR